MAHIRIIFKIDSEISVFSKENFLKLCYGLKIKITKLIESSNDLIVHCMNDLEAEKIFLPLAMRAFSDLGLKPSLPQTLKIARTVVIRNMGQEVLSKSPNGLKEEITKQNPWCAINDIWIGRHILKITFDTVQNAQNCIDHGLLLDWLHVPSHNVKRDEIIEVTICNHCLMFEDHISSKCPRKAENPQFQRCSLCGANDHHYISCNASPSLRRCLHCGGDHGTKAFKCPTRQNLIAQKIKLGSATRSFAEAAQPINTQSITGRPAASTIDPRPLPTHFNKAMNIGNCAQD